MSIRNMFQIAASEMSAEDKFTSSLSYLIDNIPEIGQAFVNVLARESSLPSSTFLCAEDHPEGNSESKPDFLLRCEHFDILCEHKLDSRLGPEQLQRYLALREKGSRTHVALITNWNAPQEISEDVLRHPFYLRPIGSKVPYFSWLSLYLIVAERRERLAKEFAAYMRGMGMAPTLLPDSWNDLFTDKQVATAFQDLTINLRDYFRNISGAICKGDPNKLGVQIQRPTPWLHLIYIYVSKTTRPLEVDINGPFIAARIFLNKAESVRAAKFHDRRNTLNTKNGVILGRQVKESVAWNKELELVYEYVAHLNEYLTDDALDSSNKLSEFGRAVFEDVSKVV